MGTRKKTHIFPQGDLQFLGKLKLSHAHFVARRSIEGVHSWLRLLVLPAGRVRCWWLKTAPWVNGSSTWANFCSTSSSGSFLICHESWDFGMLVHFKGSRRSKVHFFVGEAGIFLYITKIWPSLHVLKLSPRPKMLAQQVDFCIPMVECIRYFFPHVCTKHFVLYIYIVLYCLCPCCRSREAPVDPWVGNTSRHLGSGASRIFKWACLGWWFWLVHFCIDYFLQCLDYIPQKVAGSWICPDWRADENNTASWSLCF